MFFILKIWEMKTLCNLVFSVQNITPVLIILMGTAILAFWLVEVKRNFSSLKSRQYKWKNETGENIWFHFTAELITSVLLILAGITSLFQKSIAMHLSLFAAGLLFYASLNSLSWVFAKKQRYKLAFPMIAGILISLLAFLTIAFEKFIL